MKHYTKMEFSNNLLNQLQNIKFGILHSRVFIEGATFNDQELTKCELEIINTKHQNFIKEQWKKQN